MRDYKTENAKRREYIRNYQREWLRKRRDSWLKENGPCVECGSWEKLEVDHKDRTTKVTHAVWSWSKQRREEELAKCQVLCEDCHMKKTIAELRTHPPHGTIARYTNPHYKCRCRLCTDAAVGYVVEKRKREGRYRNAAGKLV